MQEIIVYRNPLEAQFWGALSSGQLFPIIIGVIVAVAMVVIAEWAFGKIFGVHRRPKWTSNASLFIGAFVGIFTSYFMWI
jgi:hypothetical protein